MTPPRPPRIKVQATAPPEPHLLRAAIASRLQGRPFPTRVEDDIARQIASAIHEQHENGGAPWR